MALMITKTIVGQAVIKKDYLVTTPNDIDVSDNLYVKVERIITTKEAANAVVSFTGNNINGVNNYEFRVSLEGENFIRQAYLHLKTLPEFADAEDC